MNARTVDDTYRRYFPMILAKCERTLGTRADAEDVAQDTFVALCHHRETLRDEGAVVGWIYRTATRRCVDQLRRRRTRALAPAEAPARTHAMEERAEARAIIARVAAELPEDILTVLVLHRIDRVTQPEIGRIVGVSARTVRRMLSDADDGLARVLAMTDVDARAAERGRA